jgi:hypothetical protein
MMMMSEFVYNIKAFNTITGNAVAVGFDTDN